MSFLDTLRAQYADVISEPTPPSATDAVTHDHFDQATWEEVRSNVPAIDQTITELSIKHDYVEDFARDTFNLVVKGDPQVRDTADMAPTHVPNRTMVDTFAKAPEVQQLRTLTANDPYAAAMGFVSMQSRITEAAEAMQSAREAATAAEQAQQEAQQAQREAVEALAQAQDAEAATDPEDVDGCFEAATLQQQASEALFGAEQATAAAQQAAQDTASAARQAAAGQRAGIRKAAGEAAADAEAESELMAAFGLEDGELKKMPFAERAALAKSLRNNRMAKFARLIGQFKQMATAQSRRRVQHVADEVVGVTLGDDLQRLTQGELVNLCVDELEDDFWLRYVNRQLLVYDMAGTEKMGQGPIIVVCDESGSMEDTLGSSTREAWSKAFSLALLDQARRQGRDFHYIGFSSAGQQWVTSFPQGKGPVAQVVAMCEHFFDGGTAYERPLGMALELVETAYVAKELPKPDIVFITDERAGALPARFMTRWNKTKDKLSLRCFGIAMVPTVNGALQAVADDVRVITDMTTADPGHVADVFRMI